MLLMPLQAIVEEWKHKYATSPGAYPIDKHQLEKLKAKQDEPKQ